MAAITALSSAFGLSSTTGTLATMLGLACGIDYAVFIVSRYREERAKGHTPREAAGLATGTAGSAVVFAGLTVVIALAPGLSVVGIPMLTKMGLAAAGAVMVGVFIALTLVPALLGFWPNAVLSRKARKRGRIKEGGTNNGRSRWARFVLRRPLPVLLLSVVGLGTLAVPVMDLQLGMPGDEAKPTSTTERRAYDDLAKGFGPGFNGPLSIVVDARGAANPKTAVTTIEKKIKATDGVVSVSARFNPAGDTAVFSAVPSTSPTDKKTQDLVKTIRNERPATEASTHAEFEVTGTTALNIDMAQKTQNALIPYLIVVVGLAVLLLMVVFRSILVPVKAAVGFLLSVLAALGSVVAVFQWGWLASLLGVETTGPIMSLMPIFLVGIVFGLAMDYEVFLVARMREAYVHGDSPRQAVESGFRHSARVVVAAALIMMAVFSRVHRSERVHDQDDRLRPRDRRPVRRVRRPHGLRTGGPGPARQGRLVDARPGWTGSCPRSTWRARVSSTGPPSPRRTTTRPHGNRPASDRPARRRAARAEHGALRAVRRRRHPPGSPHPPWFVAVTAALPTPWPGPPRTSPAASPTRHGGSWATSPTPRPRRCVNSSPPSACCARPAIPSRPWNRPGLGRLSELTAAFASTGLDVVVATEGEARPLAPSVDLTAFRIVQETLTNVTKHAAVKEARVLLSYFKDTVRITIDDNSSEAPAPPGPGQWLRRHRHARARQFGGRATPDVPAAGRRIHRRRRTAASPLRTLPKCRRPSTEPQKGPLEGREAARTYPLWSVSVTPDA